MDDGDIMCHPSQVPSYLQEFDAEPRGRRDRPVPEVNGKAASILRQVSASWHPASGRDAPMVLRRWEP